MAKIDLKEKFNEAIAYQNKLGENLMKFGRNFDVEKSYEEYVDFQKKLVEGLKTLYTITPKDIASDQLEKEEILHEGKMRLFHYKRLVAKTKVCKVPLLITYALVNRQYMMDLQPDRSVIKTYLEAGLDVYIIDWGYPTAEDMYLTLDDHINWYLDEAVEAVKKDAKVPQINLLGVCQGGAFSTMYTALHPENIKNLITMVVPIDFSTNDTLLFRWGKDLKLENLTKAYGIVPGDYMNFTFLILKPLTLTLDKYVGMVDKMADKTFLENFLRMEKWTFDSPGQIGATLKQFNEDLYRDNKLVKGEMVLGGKKVDLKNITQPLLVACAEKDHLVPLSASRPLLDYVSSEDKEFISFRTGHVGMYTSGQSQTVIAPKVIDWIKRHC